MATAHIRGGMEKGMKWWKEGKLTNKNTFEDFIYAAKYLIDKNILEGKIIGMGIHRWIINRSGYESVS